MALGSVSVIKFEVEGQEVVAKIRSENDLHAICLKTMAEQSNRGQVFKIIDNGGEFIIKRLELDKGMAGPRTATAFSLADIEDRLNQRAVGATQRIEDQLL